MRIIIPFRHRRSKYPCHYAYKKPKIKVTTDFCMEFLNFNKLFGCFVKDSVLIPLRQMKAPMISMKIPNAVPKFAAFTPEAYFVPNCDPKIDPTAIHSPEPKSIVFMLKINIEIAMAVITFTMRLVPMDS